MVVQSPPRVVQVSSLGLADYGGDGDCGDHRDVYGGAVVQSGGVRPGDDAGGGGYCYPEQGHEMGAKLKSQYAWLQTSGENLCESSTAGL